MVVYLFSKMSKALAGIDVVLLKARLRPPPCCACYRIGFMRGSFMYQKLRKQGFLLPEIRRVNDSFVNRTLDVELGGIFCSWDYHK